MAKKTNEVYQQFGLPVVKIRMVMEGSIYSDRKIQSVSDAVNVMCDELAQYDREAFCVVNLRNDGSVINMNIVSIGTLTASMANPREVFKSSILSNAHKILLVHNHPSGCVLPSDADYDVTKRLYKSGEILGISVLDHIIVSGLSPGDYYSFFEHDELGMSYSKKKRHDMDRGR